MASYNEIQVGRYVRLFQKLFQIKGRQPAPMSGPLEIGAVLSLFHGVENRYLEGWNRFAVNNQLSPSVGNQNAFRIRNPKGSNVTAVFEKLEVSSGNGAVVQYNFSYDNSGADLTTVVSLQTTRVDPRGNPKPSLVFSTVQSAAPGDGNLNVFAVRLIGQATSGTPDNADVVGDANHELPLFPGDAIQIHGATANITSAVNLLWRERLLEESELS